MKMGRTLLNPFEKQSMPKQSDILIIGGGVIGVCTAYYLTQRGIHVTLLERGEIASGSSYGNAGLLCPSHSLPLPAPGVMAQGIKWMLRPDSPFYMKPRLDWAFLRWLWRFRTFCQEEPVRRAVPLFRDLQRASLTLYRTLVEREKLDCHYEQVGGLTLFQSQQAFDEHAYELELLAEFGLTFHTLDASEIHAMVPRVRPYIKHGIHHQEDAHLAPARFVRHLADRAQEQGATILTNTSVESIHVSQGRIQVVQTAQRDFQPDQVILAAGAWSAEMANTLGLHIPLQPAKGYSITVTRPDDFPEMPIHLGEARVVLTPMGRHLRYAGTLELAGFDPHINQRRVSAIRRATHAYLDGLEGLEEQEVWQGYRPVPPDGLPYIGRTTAVANLIVATGHSYLGMSMGPITGKLVEQIVCEETPQIDLTALHVDRFK